MTNRQVLLLIAAFIALTFGSFLWFIITWNADAEDAIGQLKTPPTLAFYHILPPEASHAYTRVTP